MIKLSEVKLHCKRRSGRTSDIIYDLIEFLQGPADDRLMGVVIDRAELFRFYFEKLIAVLPSIIFSCQYRMSVRGENGNTVCFIVDLNYIDQFRGLRFKEIYFDTPEYQLFRDQVERLLLYIK